MITRTTPYSNTGAKNTGSGCGCGCGGGGTCTCGSASPSDTTCGCHEGTLVQPHFFAGQLLTDDDLQALSDYVITKHRRHNRFVVGSGVSCGLAVTCHPCDPGKVIVQPGYAIDCCGNDIHVPCPMELDINSMVRELKRVRLGHDCGDPCADSAKTYEKKRENEKGTETEKGTKTDDRCPEPADRYCLYLRYCELPTDLVAPYNQDDPCGASCKPSRLREGYRFELRCPEEEKKPPNFIDRVRCCFGDIDNADFQAQEMEYARKQAQRTQTAIQAIKQKQWTSFNEADEIAQIKSIQPQLTDVLNLFPSGSQALAKESRVCDLSDTDQEHGSTAPQFTEAVLLRSLDLVQILGSAIARAKLSVLSDQSKDRSRRETEYSEPLNTEFEEEQSLLVKATQKIKPLVPGMITSPMQRATADAIVSNTEYLTAPERTPDELQTQQAKLYAFNAPPSAALYNQIQYTLEEFQDWLLRKMQQCPPTTQCCLIQEVKSVVIPAGDRITESTWAAAEALMRAFIRYLIDCICSALIPPCPTCNDPAVLLACLEVKDCKVNNICNLERTFLLTENNWRYWLPTLHGFGEWLEKICCEFPKKLDKPIFPPPKDNAVDISPEADFLKVSYKDARHLQAKAQVPGASAKQQNYSHLLSLAGFSDREAKLMSSIIGSLFGTTFNLPQLTALIQAPGKAQAVFNAANTATPLANTATQKLSETLFSQVNEQIKAHVLDSNKTVGRVEDRINVQINHLNSELSKRPTANKLPSIKVIKDLQDSLDDQREVNKVLMSRLEKLEKDAKQ